MENEMTRALSLDGFRLEQADYGAFLLSTIKGSWSYMATLSPEQRMDIASLLLHDVGLSPYRNYLKQIVLQADFDKKLNSQLRGVYTLAAAEAIGGLALCSTCAPKIPLAERTALMLELDTIATEAARQSAPCAWWYNEMQRVIMAAQERGDFPLCAACFAELHSEIARRFFSAWQQR